MADFLSGYNQQTQLNQQADMGQLQQASVLQGILSKVRAEKQAQVDQQEMQELKMTVAQAQGDPAKAMTALMKLGTPKSLALAGQLKGMLPKPAEDYTLRENEIRMGRDNTEVARGLPTAEPRGQNQSNIARLLAEQAALPAGDPQRATYANAIRKESETAKQISPTVIKVGGGVGGAVSPVQGDFSKTGDDYLNTIPVSLRNTVKGVANYEINPMTFAARLGNREKMLEMVKQYNPEYDDTQYANKRRAIAQFGSGPQGNTVRSLNVAIEHIDTLKRAGDALQNGQFTPGNKAYNEVAKVFGVTPPNTFEGIRDIVANEVVKGTIGNAGALEDRKQASEKVRAASSPQQLNELMNGWVELMGGQVKGLEKQYAGASGLKDFQVRYLTQRARDAIGVAESKAGGGIREFATEADAVKSGVKGKVKIGGRNATIE